MIEQEFFAALTGFGSAEQQQAMWYEVEQSYSSSGRHYYNLSHLNAVFQELRVYRDKFVNWEVIVFATAYHDVVYNPLKSNNEERSADLAVTRLKAVSFPEELTSHCSRMILATKKHHAADQETNLFTDADLSVLGAEPDIYQEYSRQIRREYSVYPDILYKPGRKKVLARFLAMDRIYKTSEFFEKYELRARKNIEIELAVLNGQVK